VYPVCQVVLDQGKHRGIVRWRFWAIRGRAVSPVLARGHFL